MRVPNRALNQASRAGLVRNLYRTIGVVLIRQGRARYLEVLHPEILHDL